MKTNQEEFVNNMARLKGWENNDVSKALRNLVQWAYNTIREKQTEIDKLEAEVTDKIGIIAELEFQLRD